MNRIKSFLGFLSVVLASVLFPLDVAAQAVTVPPGTDLSVELTGQIYIDVAEHIKSTQNIDDMESFVLNTTVRYSRRIDTEVKLNNSDRRYLAECVMYFAGEMLSCSLRNEGLDPDDPQVKVLVDQMMEEESKKNDARLARAVTVDDAIDALGKAFN